MVEAELDRAEERADTGEIKIVELEEELRVVANNLKSLEVSEEKANQREEQSLQRGQSRNSRRRWTGWRMSSCPSRRSSRPSQRSSSRPSRRCPDTKFTLKKRLKPQESYAYVILL